MYLSILHLTWSVTSGLSNPSMTPWSCSVIRLSSSVLALHSWKDAIGISSTDFILLFYSIKKVGAALDKSDL